MDSLRVYALGKLRVLYNQEPLHFPTRKAQELLCFLLLNAGEMLDRDHIAERLWPMRSPEKGRRSLATALWRLRQTLPVTDTPEAAYLLSRRHTVGFNKRTSYWFDVAAFEQQAAIGLSGSLPCLEDHGKALEEALDLYQGDFLEGCYDDWCLVERERQQLLFIRVLKRLLRHARLCETYEVAISLGQRLLALDPLQEEVYRELMRCYEAEGERAQALAQFQRCRNTLRQQLQVEPMPETWQLYRRVRQGQEAAGLPKTKDHSPSLQAALAQFRRALDTLESAWQMLQSVNVDLTEPDRPL